MATLTATTKLKPCKCGCGKPTPIAYETRPSRGWVKGEPTDYYPHHRKVLWPVVDGKKQCRNCERRLPTTDFWKNKANGDGWQYLCKNCSKAQSYGYRTTEHGAVRVYTSRLKSGLQQYRLTEAEYERMLVEQDYRCAICAQPEMSTYKGKPKRLSVDHCHSTGEIRGLLCSRCNRAIGYFKDDANLLAKAIKYLTKETIS